MLDPETEAAIAPALPSLAKVSRERVCDELRKLARGAPAVARARARACARGSSRRSCPSWRRRDRWSTRVDRATDARAARRDARAAGRAEACRTSSIGTLAKRVADILRGAQVLERGARAGVAALVAVAHAHARDGLEPRRCAACSRSSGATSASRPIELWASEAAPNTLLRAPRGSVLGDPLAVGDLAVTGKELMNALAMQPGPAIGRILAMLLQRVIDDPALQHAREAARRRAEARAGARA